MKANPPVRNRQGGFTLVELLIVISMLGLLMTALVFSLNAMMVQTTASQTRVEVSHDAQIAAAYFAEDVAAMGVRNLADENRPLVQSIETNATSMGGTYRCGASSLPNAVVRLAWDEFTDGSTEVRTRVVVSYVVVPTSTEEQLHRVVCRVTPAPASPTNTTPISDVVVAHNVSDVELNCSGSCTSSTPPRRVDLILKLAQPGSADTLTVTLSGQRRQT